MHHGFITAYLCSPLLFPLLCVGDDLWNVRYGFSARLGKYRASRGTSTLFFVWNVTQCVRSSCKQSIVIHCDWWTHPLFWLITGVHFLTVEHSIFFVMAGLIVEILFMLLSVYYAVEWIKNQWIWSIMASRFSDN